MYDRLRTRLDAGRQDDGFTLIELLIVIVILGVLAGIVVFAVGGITDRGEKSACKSDVKSVEVAQEAHFAKNKAYAADAAALVTAKYLRSAPTGSGSPAVDVVTTDNTGAVFVDGVKVGSARVPATGTPVTEDTLASLCA